MGPWPAASPTKVMMLHNAYQQPGGEDQSTVAEVALLRQHGHEVILLEKQSCEIAHYSNWQKVHLAWQTTWNPQVVHWLQNQLQHHQPDLVHVQNFFPLYSPAVHAAAQSQGKPTLQHLRNFRLGCLSPYLLRQGQICEVCVGRNPWRGVWYGCYRQSRFASLALWAMITLHRWCRTWQTQVNGFITPSQFAAQKLMEIGIPGDRLYVKPNVTADPTLGQPIPPPRPQPTFLIAGRLSPEKGVHIVLQAWRQLQQADWQLWVLGDGPQRPQLEQYCQEQRLTNVTFRGHCPHADVMATLPQAWMVLIPSQWYEVFGRLVVEAYAWGRPVLASQLGALPELIKPGQTGDLVPAGDVGAWTERLRWWGERPHALSAMGQQARKCYLEKYTPQVNYIQLTQIYQKVLLG